PVEIQNTPGSIGQASSPALSRLLAADAVAVAIEVCAVPRVAHAHRCGTGLTRGGAVLVMRRPVRGPGGAGAGRTLRTRRLGGALGLRRLLRLLRGRDVVAVAGGGPGRVFGECRLLVAVGEHALHRGLLRLDDPESVLVFDRDLAGDVFAAVALVRRQPGRGVPIALLTVEVRAHREQVERIVAELLEGVLVEVRRPGLPRVRAGDDVVDVDVVRGPIEGEGLTLVVIGQIPGDDDAAFGSGPICVPIALLPVEVRAHREQVERIVAELLEGVLVDVRRPGLPRVRAGDDVVDVDVVRGPIEGEGLTLVVIGQIPGDDDAAFGSG